METFPSLVGFGTTIPKQDSYVIPITSAKSTLVTYSVVWMTER